MRTIRGGLASGIRRLASEGVSAFKIASRFDLALQDVRAFLKTPRGADRCAKGADRRILGQTATRVRDLVDRGWGIADIAAALELDPDRVRDFVDRYRPVRRGKVTRPRTRAEQARLEENAQKWQARRERRNHPKPVDAWKAAAAVDPRYRDVETTRPAAPIDQADGRTVPAIAAAPPADLPGPPADGAEIHQRIITESWGNYWNRGEKHPQARLGADDVREIRRLHANGLGYRRIAARFGVHHQTIQAIISGRSWSSVI